jgi:hypothetical protein
MRQGHDLGPRQAQECSPAALRWCESTAGIPAQTIRNREIGPGVLTFGAPLGTPPRATPTRLALLDRDGVLIVDRGHVSVREQVEWIAGVPQAIGSRREAGYAVAIVSNQAGIAKRLYTEEQFVEFMR